MVVTSSAKTWEEHSFPISFPSSPMMHLASGLSESCGGVGIAGAATGHYDKDYFRIATEFQNVYVRWLVMSC